MIKHYIFRLSVLIFSSCAFAQQDVLYSQYMFNQMAFNPAFAGSQNKLNASLLHKQYYIPGAYNSNFQNFQLHSPAYHKKIGLGVQVTNERSFLTQNLEFSAVYAYRIIISKGVLAMGVGFGFKQSKYNLEGSNVLIKDPDDPVLNNVQKPVISPDIQAGMYYQRKNWQWGLSAKNMISTFVVNNSPYEVRKLHLYFHSGYKAKISSELELISFALLKYAVAFPAQLDLTTHFVYNKFVWAGFSYRTYQAFSIQSGIKIDKIVPKLKQDIKIGYAFDYYAGLSFSSHEIMLLINWESHKSPDKIKKQKAQISPFF